MKNRLRKNYGSWHVYTACIFASALAYFYSVNSFAVTYEEARAACATVERNIDVYDHNTGDFSHNITATCNDDPDASRWRCVSVTTGTQNSTYNCGQYIYFNPCAGNEDMLVGSRVFYKSCGSRLCFALPDIHPTPDDSTCQPTNCDSYYTLVDKSTTYPSYDPIINQTVAREWSRYNFFYNGQSCVYTDPGEIPTEPEEPSCGPGQNMASFNNQPVCLNSDGSVDSVDNSGESGIDVTDGAVSETESESSSTTSTDQSGTTTETHTTTYADGTVVTDTTVTASNGSTTETSTRNNPGGGSTTSTTITDSDGNSTTSNESESSVCELEPSNPACSDSSAKGVCDSPFHCRGDPIQCVQAKYLFELKCSGQPSDEEKEIIKMVKPGMDETSLIGTYSADVNPLNPANIEEIDVANEIDSSGFLSGGGCPTDPTVSVLGTSITLPFSVLCPYLEMMGNIMIVIASIIAFMIVGS